MNTSSLSQQASAQSTEADVHKELETSLENMSSTRRWAAVSGGCLCLEDRYGHSRNSFLNGHLKSHLKSHFKSEMFVLRCVLR